MITNQEYIEHNITSDGGEKLSFLWTHGATSKHLGDGIMVYSLIQHMRYKSCVCIGTGGGYIPRIMTQARIDLYDQGIFEGDRAYSWGDIGCTYVVDPCNGVGGQSTIDDEKGFYRTHFYPRFIKETSERAYYDFFVREDITIDLLFIDGDHSYEGVKKDFDLYSKLVSPHGIILIHDTDKSYSETLIVSEDAKKDFFPFDGPSRLVEELKNNSEWVVMDLFNYGILKDKPSSTGLTIVKRK
jgi:hypothetical protein